MSTLSAQESSETSSLVDDGWVSWFISLNGNHVFCEIEKQFMEDSFNLFGLKQYITKDFTKVMNTILDQIDLDENENEELSKSAAFLYGLIHARYIISTNGLHAMRRKYLMREFGECPRTYCNGQAVLPVGRADDPRLGSYSLFCPKCRDLYNCHPSQRHIDGAFFGTTFPHVFMMTFQELVPSPPTASYVPRLFGFKIHPSSSSLPKPSNISSNYSSAALNQLALKQQQVNNDETVGAIHNNESSNNARSNSITYSGTTSNNNHDKRKYGNDSNIQDTEPVAVIGSDPTKELPSNEVSGNKRSRNS